jgi:hypothetical protein
MLKAIGPYRCVDVSPNNERKKVNTMKTLYIAAVAIVATICGIGFLVDEANGLSGTVAWSKAATLLGAAKIQQQFEEYQNCVIKVQKARAYLRGS